MGDEWIESSPVDKHLGILVDETFNYELATCACSPESQSWPGLRKMSGDSSPLLYGEPTWRTVFSGVISTR